MEVIIIDEKQLYQLLEERHNAPLVRDQKDQNLFQEEIRSLYDKLVDSLSAFGLEGDYYGVSDFAVRPDLRDRPTTKAPPAPHLREFAVTILTQKFYKSGYLASLRHFLLHEGAGYRIEIAQDFDPKWHLTFFLMDDQARVYCTSDVERSRLTGALESL